MKTKPIPALITLAAGLITCIISFIYQVSIEDFLKSLLLVIVVFYVIGSVVKMIFDKNFPLEENEVKEQLKKQEEQEKEKAEQEEQNEASESE